MKRMVKLLLRRGSGIRCHPLPNCDFSVLNQWWGHLLKQEPECGDPTLPPGAPVSPHWRTSPAIHLREAGGPQFPFTLLKAELPSACLVGNPGSEWLCSVEGRTSCCVCFQNETQGRLGTAFPGVTSAILACVSLAVGRNLITVTSSRGRALAREGRGGRTSLTAYLCTSEFGLRFCPHNVVTRAVLLKGVFKSFWQRGKGNLLSALSLSTVNYFPTTHGKKR